ncbi:YqcC family protein [Colwellia sp. MEBiC06753]
MSKSSITLLLAALTESLQSAALWSQTEPSAEQLASAQPFCLDTLAFEQWLQFIFIPRINAMVAQNIALPTNVAIYPYAEEVLEPSNIKHQQVLNVIKQIDQRLSEQSHH